MTTDTPAAAPITAERELIQRAWDWMAENEKYVFAGSESAWKQMTLIAADLRARLSAPVAAQPAASESEVLQQALAALETAHTGLMWYRGMMPEYVDGSDHDADEEITAAVEGLRAHLSTALKGEQTHG